MKKSKLPGYAKDIPKACGTGKYRVRMRDGWVEVWESGITGWSQVFDPIDAVEIARAMIDCADAIDDLEN